jgi:hypothetical protein
MTSFRQTIEIIIENKPMFVDVEFTKTESELDFANGTGHTGGIEIDTIFWKGQNITNLCKAAGLDEQILETLKELL